MRELNGLRAFHIFQNILESDKIFHNTILMYLTKFVILIAFLETSVNHKYFHKMINTKLCYFLTSFGILIWQIIQNNDKGKALS